MEISGGWRDLWRELHDSIVNQGRPEQGRLQELLRDLLQGSLEEKNRESVSVEDVALLHSLLSPLSSHPLLPPHNETLTNTVKLLRNISAGMAGNQKAIIESGAISTVADLLSMHILPWLQASGDSTPEVEGSSVTSLGKACLQLLGNVCVRHELGQKTVWRLCFPELFKSLTCCNHGDIVDMSSMVIHMCTLHNPDHRDQLCCYENGEIIGNVLVLAVTDHQMEWTAILLDALLESLSLSSLYQRIDVRNTAKLHLLEYVLLKLDSDDTENETQSVDCPGDLATTGQIFTEENLVFLGKNLQSSASVLESADLSRVTKDHVATNLEDPLHCSVRITMATVKLLCQFTQREQCLRTLQRHSSFPALLAACVALLNHLAGFDGSDASGKHQSQLRSVTPSGQEKEHLMFGFKKALVHLIANLCYKSRQAQDQSRELQAIPLILNQCSIDHHNPYITQWAVFAVRNLCEDNPANQEVIAGLESRGVADTHSLLEFGCEVEVGDDGKIRVKPRQRP